MAKARAIGVEMPILTSEDLGRELHPFFNSRAGRWIGNGLLRLLRVTEINQIHSDYAHLTGPELTSALLKDRRIDVSYTIHHQERLVATQAMGAFFTISNHPFGGLDGLILIDIMSRIRGDFMVLVNGILDRVSALREYWIPVLPEMKDRQHRPDQNISGLRFAVQRLMDGHPVGMFPAGGLPHYHHSYQRPLEIPWKLKNIRIMRKAKVPIVPIMFEGNNSKWYYKYGERRGYNRASILIPREILNKRGRNIDVYIGETIFPSELETIGTLEQTRVYLMERALSLLPSYRGKLDYLISDKASYGKMV